MCKLQSNLLRFFYKLFLYMLTHNSQLLINHIDQKLYPKSDKRSKKKTHKNVSLYKEYRELYNFLESINTHYEVNDINQSKTESYSSIKIDSPFISSNINQEIQSFNNFYSFLLRTNKSFIRINIYYSDEDLTEFLRVIKHAVSFIFNITNHKVLNCTINYYLS